MLPLRTSCPTPPTAALTAPPRPQPAFPRTARRNLRGRSPQAAELEGRRDGDLLGRPRNAAPRTCAAPVYSRSAHPSAGAGRGNAIKRLSLVAMRREKEERGGTGPPPQSRAGCSAARPALAALPAATEAGKGQAGGRGAINRVRSPGWGRKGTGAPRGVRARSPASSAVLPRSTSEPR